MTTNWQNRTLFHGDNLDFLRAMNSNSVDLIATDPPFNKGRDFHATPDSLASGASFQDRWSWEDDVHPDWLDKLADDFPKVLNVVEGSRNAYGDDMGAFLCFMAVRLLEMRRVLKDTGSIYLHCDPTASHYLKELMDAVFGAKRCMNEIIWCYDTGGRGKRHFPRKHETIFWYSKSINYIFDYDQVALPRDTSTMHEPVLKDENGRSYQRNFKNGKEYKYYLDKGVLPNSWWTDIPALNPAAKERTGYPTQKPLPLYERIIKASSNPGDMVLDPFCGCATTLVAAEKLNRHWVGIDIWEKAHEVVIDRLKQEGRLSDGKGGIEADLFVEGDITYTTTPPQRTDDGDSAAPHLRVKERVKEPDGPKQSRAEMYDYLIRQNGLKCQGCDRQFDDPRYLELDHNVPRSDGGINHISNRILLCGPSNKVKSNIYTLSGLRRENKKRGFMAGQQAQK